MADTFNITALDFQVRVQKIACCLAAKGYTIAKSLKIGKYCHEDVKKYLYAMYMFKRFKCYDTAIEGEETLDDINCLTTDQVNSTFEWYQDYCDLCFSPDYEYYDNLNTIPN